MFGDLVKEWLEEEMGGEDVKMEWIDNSFGKFGREGEHVTG